VQIIYTNIVYRHDNTFKDRDITEILLEVALNTINQTTFKERKIQLKICNNDTKNVYYMINLIKIRSLIAPARHSKTESN